MNASVTPDSRLPEIGVSIFAVMTRLANEHGAINLSQGFPDFDCSPGLVALVREWLGRGQNQYAPMPGVLRLRQAISRMILDLYGAEYDPDTEITVTAGATEALFSTLTALVHTGDEVVLFEPCYDSYVPAVRLAGGRPVFVTLRYPGYAIDWDAVARVVSPRTRVIVVNTPHNPTGTILTMADLDRLAALVDGSRIVVVGDEVYEHLVFDGERHASLARHAALASRSVVISSFGKSFHTTGWKIGYAAAPRALTTEVQRVHQFVTFAVNTPVQNAYAEFLERGVDFAEVGRFYQAKRDRFLSLVERSRFRPAPCRGTYFQILDYSGFAAGSDVDVAMQVLKEHGVASVPTSAFLYASEHPPVLRFCFAKRDETLVAAAERLNNV